MNSASLGHAIESMNLLAEYIQFRPYFYGGYFNIAPAGIKRAYTSAKKGVSSGYRWLPTSRIPYILIIIAGITNANINISKYFVIENDGVVVGFFAAF
ncbi:hypothetical protein [Nitrososphaera sp. AFS]|uniref:hypothetical protein n=1 Tax=Nitrososphaera sp. AFS TaxID=2301191 RepID=UPI001392378F|nr:hypothetical protein [Nitrososphaera sp. AFS]